MSGDTGVFARIAERIGMKAPQQQQRQQNQQQGGGSNNNQQQPLDSTQQVQERQQQNQQQAQKPTGPQSVDDMVKGLWHTDKNADGGAQAAAAKKDGKLFNVDMKGFGEAVGKMDFSQHVKPELAQKALAGDAEALKELLNGVGRGSFSQSLLTSSQMMEEAFGRKEKALLQQMDERFNAMSTRSNLRKANPAFSNPQVKPIVEFVASQLEVKYPDSTPEERTEAAQKYFMDMVDTLSKQGKDEQNQSQRQQQDGDNGRFANENDGSFDWMKFAETNDNADQPAFGPGGRSPLSS